jgi:hypothetical protein
MASLIYNSALYDMARALVDFDSDTFKVLLTTSIYTENKRTHAKRSDITNEVAGAGYTAGGAAATITVTLDNANDRIDIALGAASWPAATITARKAVYYKARGGAASADEIVGVIDFVTDVTSTAGTYSLSASTLRLSNP